MNLQFDNMTFDADTHQLWVDGAEKRLSTKAFALLALLVSHRPHAVVKADIRAHLWPGTFVSDSSLPSLVSEIREAIADHRRKPVLLRTVHGFGYAFQAPGPASSQQDAAANEPDGWLIGSAGEVALFAGENVLGRNGAGIIPVNSTTVSRRHARIVIDEKAGVVEDLGSKNGTYVNDRRVSEPTPIADGDQVRIGSLLFTFRLAQHAESTQTQTSRSGSRSHP